VAARAFAAGERVFCERALVVASGHTNLARVRAYCGLTHEGRRALREQYFGEAPAVRCAATAACRPDAVGSGDSAAEVFEALRAEDEHGDLTLDEVQSVIRVWNLNAYDCALAPVACKVNHSCAPNVSVHVDVDTGTITATACRPILKGEVLGSWYFQDTGLWWMGTDVRRALFETDRGFLCACARCCTPDRCRSLPCDLCSKGASVPEGKAVGASPGNSAPLAWQCSACGHSAPGNAVRLAAEAEVVPRVLLELRPPKGVPRSAPEEIVALASDVRAKLGPRHWASAAAALVMHFRVRPPGGALDAFAVACGCRFLGWLMDSGLPQPPAAIVRTPISVTLDCAAWLTRDMADGKTAARDRRCIVGRLLSQFLLPIFDASGEAVAKVANTGMRVQVLREWLHKLQCTCGHCGRSLAADKATSGDADCTAAPTAMLSCGRCKQVRYCGRECQLADWKAGHKAGCLAASESLAGEAAWQLLTSA